MKTALLVDVESLYFNLNVQYNLRLDYSMYLKYIEEKGHAVDIKFAFGVQDPVHVSGFVYTLKELGFITKFERRPNIILDYALTCVNMIESVDTFILGTSNTQFDLLLSWLESRGKKVHLISSRVPKELFKFAACSEIPRRIMQGE